MFAGECRCKIPAAKVDLRALQVAGQHGLPKICMDHGPLACHGLKNEEVEEVRRKRDEEYEDVKR